ncbi:unnamed protein product, partial [Lota lota]
MLEDTQPHDDSYIVRVKAVVMSRDDSSGGWLAQDGGALSRVGVCRLLAPTPATGSLSPGPFLIHGERLLDHQVILECPLRRDLLYTAATPTFHHWKVEDRRCGLSFQSPADARAFDRGVRKAIEDLAEGSTTLLHHTPQRGGAGRRRSLHQRHRQLVQLLPADGGLPPPTRHIAPPPKTRLQAGASPRQRLLRALPPHGPVPVGTVSVQAPSSCDLPGGRGDREDQPAGAELGGRPGAVLADGLRGLPPRRGARPLPAQRPVLLLRALLQDGRPQARVLLPPAAVPPPPRRPARTPRGQDPRPRPPRRFLGLRTLRGDVLPVGQPEGAVPGRPGPGGGVRAAGQLHVAGRQHAVPLHVGPRGGLLGPLLVRGRGRGRAPPGAALASPGGVVPGGAVPVSLPPPPCLPPRRAGLGLLWGAPQGRQL